jgi:hypothetical protein
VVAMPIVPAEIWVQYSIVAVLLAAGGAVAFAFYRLWHELLGWLELQDEKRENEREKQRIWQADLSRTRDAQMQLFLKQMQDQWTAQDQRSSAVLDRLASKVEELTVAINDHDTWARASSNDPLRPRKR